MAPIENDQAPVYHAPPSLEPEISRYNRHYYLFALLGAATCGILAFTYLFIFKHPLNQRRFMNIMFIPFVLILLVSTILIKRNNKEMKKELYPILGQVPADFGTIFAAASTIDNQPIKMLAKKFYRYQLLGAFLSGYYIALAIPLLAYVAM